MPSALVVTVLLSHVGRGISKTELVKKVKWFREEIIRRGGQVTQFAEGNPGKYKNLRRDSNFHFIEILLCIGLFLMPWLLLLFTNGGQEKKILLVFLSYKKTSDFCQEHLSLNYFKINNF